MKIRCQRIIALLRQAVMAVEQGELARARKHVQEAQNILDMLLIVQRQRTARA